VIKERSNLSLRAAQRALKSFREFQLAERDEKIGPAIDLLRRFGEQRSGLIEFQPFKAWQPTENELSDVLAGILDPHGTHGLGIVPLVSLLTTLKSRAPDATRIERLIAFIMHMHDSIRVQREHLIEGARPDVSITVPRQLLILIEHKRSAGYETYINGRLQTERLWNYLRTWSDRHRSGKDRWLGIILSPDGREAECSKAREDIIPISTLDIGTAITHAREHCGAPSAARHIPTFLDFYSRYEIMPDA
jgi:hypothetical protein